MRKEVIRMRLKSDVYALRVIVDGTGERKNISLDHYDPSRFRIVWGYSPRKGDTDIIVCDESGVLCRPTTIG